jgi:hypothetical protein
MLSCNGEVRQHDVPGQWGSTHETFMENTGRMQSKV